MSRKMAENKSKPLYRYVEKNIYKTGSVYRVRVKGFSCYTYTLNKARAVRKFINDADKQGEIF